LRSWLQGFSNASSFFLSKIHYYSLVTAVFCNYFWVAWQAVTFFATFGKHSFILNAQSGGQKETTNLEIKNIMRIKFLLLFSLIIISTSIAQKTTILKDMLLDGPIN